MTVFLYAGQGSQFVGMGKDFYEEYPAFRETLDSLQLPFDYKKIMFEGPMETLSDTVYTQPCMMAFGIGVTRLLKDAGIQPDAVCGLSLGEYGALHCAGVWDEQTSLSLVAYRGKVMADAVKGKVYVMSAVMGTKAEEVEEVCTQNQDKGFVTVANYNCPGQYVICGEEEAVAAVEAQMGETYGARCVRLQTTSPFHTRLLKEAGDALREKFRSVEFKQPSIPVYMNVTGEKLQEGEDIKELLEQQVQKSVRMESILRSLMEDGADRFIEIGPGKVLTGLCKKTARALGKKVTAAAISKAEDLKGVL